MRRRIRYPLYICAAIVVLCLVVWAALPKPDLWGDLDFSRHIYDRNGTLLRLDLTSDQKYRIWLPLGDMPPDLVEATLLYEDRYFRWHPGVNPAAVLRAAFSSYVAGGRRMGASTITMQLARLRFGLDTTSISGKFRQMWLALQLERHYSKDQILEAYFNLAPYGGNIEGVGAAAAVYFRKRAAILSLPECLSLVAVPQNPAARNPLAARGKAEAGGSALDDARLRVNELWVEAHPEDAGNAYFSGLPLSVAGANTLPFAAPHLTTELLAGTERPKAGQGGAIRATLDLESQRLLERVLKNFLAHRKDVGLVNASALLVHWPSMETRALIGSADFFSKDIQGQVDGTRGLRSPGSTLKPFIYALGLDQGQIHPQSLMIDAPRSFAGYDPENADMNFRGPLSARDALFFSRNIPAITLASRLRHPDLYEFLQAAHLDLPKNRDHYGLALVLGGAELTARRLAELYAMLANRGQWQPLLFAREKKSAEDEGRMPERLLSPEAAVLTLAMIRDNPAARQMRYVGKNLDKFPIYWKTGTSNGFRDAWTAGIFGPYVLVVWVGNFDNTPNPYLTGATAAAPLFLEIAQALGSRERIVDTAMRDLNDLNVVEIPVCAATGDTDTSLCPETVRALFIPGVSPIRSSGVFRSILVDTQTGLRACVEDPPRTKRVVWEFWSTDLQRIFRSAGIAKAPPPRFMPGCAPGPEEQGVPPAIIVPKYGVVYHASLGSPENSLIPLSASADADVDTLFWFEGPRLIGSSSPFEPLFWQAKPGRVALTVTDNFGRSATRVVWVESVP